MRHAMIAAVIVKSCTALDASDRLQATLRIIESAVNDLAVARRRLESDRVGLFENDDFMPGQREGARDRQSDDPGANDDRFDLVHLYPFLEPTKSGTAKAPPDPDAT